MICDYKRRSWRCTMKELPYGMVGMDEEGDFYKRKGKALLKKYVGSDEWTEICRDTNCKICRSTYVTTFPGEKNESLG